MNCEYMRIAASRPNDARFSSDDVAAYTGTYLHDYIRGEATCSNDVIVNNGQWYLPIEE